MVVMRGVFVVVIAVFILIGQQSPRLFIGFMIIEILGMRQWLRRIQDVNHSGHVRMHQTHQLEIPRRWKNHL